MGKAAYPSGRDDTMAGRDDGKRIVSAGLADGAGDAAERFGELAVGACLPAGDLAYCSPGAAPEVAPLLSEREVEPVVGVGEVTGQLLDGLFGGNAGWLQRGGTARQEDDFAKIFGICDDAQRAERGWQDRRKGGACR